jgi:hypothetical protein
VTPDERPKCGQPTKSGAPCGAYADLCRHHGPKAAAAQDGAGRQGVAVPAKTGGPGNPHDPAVKEAAAVRLARGEGVVAVAAALGLPHQTVSDWRKDPEFSGLVRHLRADLVDAVTGRLSATGVAAVDTLVRGIRGEAKPVEIRAADVLLTKLLAYREASELEARVAELEALLSGGDDAW